MSTTRVIILSKATTCLANVPDAEVNYMSYDLCYLYTTRNTQSFADTFFAFTPDLQKNEEKKATTQQRAMIHVTTVKDL